MNTDKHGWTEEKFFAFKPRKRGLSIEPQQQPIFSFCFSAARANQVSDFPSKPTVQLFSIRQPISAPPKNKKKNLGTTVVYRQATPTGFGELRR
jgi:hypothetical protein